MAWLPEDEDRLRNEGDNRRDDQDEAFETRRYGPPPVSQKAARAALLCDRLKDLAGNPTDCFRLVDAVDAAEAAMRPDGTNDAEHEALRDLVDLLTGEDGP
jgi:hypothetical protein